MTERDRRQTVVGEWVCTRFGDDAFFDRRERVARLLEEAAELAQAEGLTRDDATRIVDYVWSRDAGEPYQEAGGVCVTLLAYAQSKGFSLDAAEAAEIERIHAKPAEHFRMRQAAKAGLGVARPPRA